MDALGKQEEISPRVNFVGVNVVDSVELVISIWDVDSAKFVTSLRGVGSTRFTVNSIAGGEFVVSSCDETNPINKKMKINFILVTLDDRTLNTEQQLVNLVTEILGNLPNSDDKYQWGIWHLSHKNSTRTTSAPQNLI